MSAQPFKPVTLKGRIDDRHRLLLALPAELPVGDVAVTIAPRTAVTAANERDAIIEFIDEMASLSRMRGQDDDAVEARLNAERAAWD